MLNMNEFRGIYDNRNTPIVSCSKLLALIHNRRRWKLDTLSNELGNVWVDYIESRSQELQEYCPQFRSLAVFPAAHSLIAKKIHLKTIYFQASRNLNEVSNDEKSTA